MASDEDSAVRLGFRTREGETMRETVKRYAARFGLEYECLSYYDSERDAGQSEAQAAMFALSEWDLLDLFDADGEAIKGCVLDE